ncbi:MAG TPA: hypothetical protein PLZ51_03530, partial [Aggregatilineales bacterium]|nr:hypothetical protein [Aggregatilineales bacterium]
QWNGTRGAVTCLTRAEFEAGNYVVDATNSLVGSAVADFVGNAGITILTNGNYVVRSSNWANGGATRAGAVTWVNGSTCIPANESTRGAVVSATNSLVGTTTNDLIGNTSVTALTNGNYVVGSQSWNNGAITTAGAVTWADGTTGITGPVTTLNSLHGTTITDGVGTFIIALTNGNYVVRSFNWNNGGALDAGAVTWGDGTTGITGPVTSGNSLVGSTTNDRVGGSSVTALTNGNYVVASLNWSNGAITNTGAVTWADGTTGITGPVTTANSLHGSTINDNVGFGVVALTNGNYVVRSSNWDDGGTAD